MNSKTYSVHQVAQNFQVSPHTIRYYDSQHLFPEVARDEHGARVFTQEQMDWLGMVLCLRSTGLSVAEIRRFVELAEKGPSTVRERYEIILAQKRRAEAERAAIDHKLEILERKLAHYEKQLPQSE